MSNLEFNIFATMKTYSKYFQIKNCKNTDQHHKQEQVICCMEESSTKNNEKSANNSMEFKN